MITDYCTTCTYFDTCITKQHGICECDSYQKKINGHGNMTTEPDLKSRITPDMIRWLCKLAEGFEYREHGGLTFNSLSVYEYGIDTLLPLLLHRAAEGWDKEGLENSGRLISNLGEGYISLLRYNDDTLFFHYEKYTPSTLTAGECALLDCMLRIYTETTKKEV